MSPIDVCAYLDRILPDAGRSDASSSLRTPELRAQVQPGRHPVTHADLEIAESALGDRGAVRDLAQVHPAVRGLHDDAGAGPIDRDRAARGVDARVAAGLTDPGVAIRVLHPGGAADAHPARAGDDLGLAGHAVDGDVAGAGLEVQGTDLLEETSPTPTLAALAQAAGRAAATTPTSACASPRATRSRRRSSHRDAKPTGASRSVPSRPSGRSRTRPASARRPSRRPAWPGPTDRPRRSCRRDRSPRC